MTSEATGLAAGDRGGWMQTYSGRQFFPLRPKLEDIEIEDIARGLAFQVRWAGQTREPYSIAQHSVLVSRLVPEGEALWGLLHDASEAYIVDVPRLIKRLPAMAPYRLVEQVLQQAIYHRFGLVGGPEPASVKAADLQMMVAEAQDLLPTLHPGWPEPIRQGTAARPPWRITECWSPARARSTFLARFETLMQARAAAAAAPAPVTGEVTP